jgi:hypothetical protein
MIEDRQVERLKEMHDWPVVDATHTIEVYENGKTWDCTECDSGAGTVKEAMTLRCYGCYTLLVDRKYENRDVQEPDRSGEDGQMTIGDFI